MDWDEPRDVEEQTVGYFMRGMKNLWTLLDKQKGPMALLIGCVGIAVMLELGFPYLLMMLFDELPEVLKTINLSKDIVIIAISVFVLRLATISFHHFVRVPLYTKSYIWLENWWPVMALKKLAALHIGYHEKENIGKKSGKIQRGCERLVEILGMLH